MAVLTFSRGFRTERSITSMEQHLDQSTPVASLVAYATLAISDGPTASVVLVDLQMELTYSDPPSLHFVS